MTQKNHGKKRFLPVLLLALALFIAGIIPVGAQASTTTNFAKLCPKADKAVIKQVKRHGGKAHITNDFNSYYSGYTYGYFWIRNGKKHMKLTMYLRPSYLNTCTPYHELGHCVDFLLSNAYIKNGKFYISTKSRSKTFKKIYNKEQKHYRPLENTVSRSYTLANSFEYFAQSYADYTLYPRKFKAMCPATYNYIKKCVKKIRKGQVIPK